MGTCIPFQSGRFGHRLGEDDVGNIDPQQDIRKMLPHGKLGSIFLDQRLLYVLACLHNGTNLRMVAIATQQGQTIARGTSDATQP